MTNLSRAPLDPVRLIEASLGSHDWLNHLLANCPHLEPRESQLSVSCLAYKDLSLQRPRVKGKKLYATKLDKDQKFTSQQVSQKASNVLSFVVMVLKYLEEFLSCEGILLASFSQKYLHPFHHNHFLQLC